MRKSIRALLSIGLALVCFARPREAQAAIMLWAGWRLLSLRNEMRALLLIGLVLAGCARPLQAQQLIEFWAVWCKPCAHVTPELGKAASRGATIVRVNVGVDKQTAAQHGVTQIPCVIGLDAQGRDVGRLVGADHINEQTLLALWQKACAKLDNVRQDPNPSIRACLPTKHPGAVRVMATDLDGTSWGSGTLIGVSGQVGFVVTNWHVVKDLAPGKAVVITFADGSRAPARVRGVDPVWDLAVLDVARPNVSPTPIAATPPRPGDTTYAAGYGSGDYRAIAGRCTQYMAPSEGAANEILEMSGSMRDGDSGGPVLNSRGELVAVLFGSKDQRTSGTFCLRIRMFLEQHGIRGPFAPPQQAGPSTGAPAIQPGQAVAPTFSGGEQQPPVAAPAPSIDLGPLQGALQAVEAKVASHGDELASIRSKLDGDLAQIGGKLQTDLPDLVAKVEGLQTSTDPNSLGALIKQVAGPLITAAVGSAVPGLGTIAGAAGLSSAAVTLLGWLLKKVPAVAAAASSPAIAPAAPSVSLPLQPAAPPVVLRTDTPPLPQVTSMLQQFYPVQTPTAYEQALKEAIKQYGQKFPGATATLNQIESWAQQILAATPKTTA